MSKIVVIEIPLIQMNDPKAREGLVHAILTKWEEEIFPSLKKRNGWEHDSPLASAAMFSLKPDLFHGTCSEEEITEDVRAIREELERKIKGVRRDPQAH